MRENTLRIIHGGMGLYIKKPASLIKKAGEGDAQIKTI